LTFAGLVKKETGGGELWEGVASSTEGTVLWKEIIATNVEKKYTADGISQVPQKRLVQ